MLNGRLQVGRHAARSAAGTASFDVFSDVDLAAGVDVMSDAAPADFHASVYSAVNHHYAVSGAASIEHFRVAN